MEKESPVSRRATTFVAGSWEWSGAEKARQRWWPLPYVLDRTSLGNLGCVPHISGACRGKHAR